MRRLHAATDFKLTSPRGTMHQPTNQRLTGLAGRPETILPSSAAASNASFKHAELNATLQVIKQ